MLQWCNVGPGVCRYSALINTTSQLQTAAHLPPAYIRSKLPQRDTKLSDKRRKLSHKHD